MTALVWVPFTCPAKNWLGPIGTGPVCPLAAAALHNAAAAVTAETSKAVAMRIANLIVASFSVSTGRTSPTQAHAHRPPTAILPLDHETCGTERVGQSP